MQPPRITSSLDTQSWATSDTSDSPVERTTSTTSASDVSNVYVQRPRTTSSLTSKYESMPSGSSPASYSYHPSAGTASNERWSSSTTHTANKTTRTIPLSKSKTSTGGFNFTTTYNPAVCSGTTTVYVPPNATRTRTVTETYFVTVFGVFTDFAPPPVSTFLPFCDTVQIPYRNTTSSTPTCSGTGQCITFVHTTTTTRSGSRMTSLSAAAGSESFQMLTAAASSIVALGSARPEVVTTLKHPVTVFIGDTPPPSFGPTSPVPAEPIQTGPDAKTPTQEHNVPIEPTLQSRPFINLGGIIASVFNNPFPTPKPAPSPPAGDSSNGGSPNGGTEPNRGSPESGGPNRPSSVSTPPAPISPQTPSQHDNPVIDVTTQSVLVSLATSRIVVGGMTFPADLQPTTVAIEGQIFSINPSQVVASGITLNIPPPASAGAAPSLNSPAGVSVDIKSNNIVIGGHTFTAGSPPTSTVINGQTFAVNAAQPQTPGPVITAPPSTSPRMAPKLVTVANVPLAIQSGNVVIGGQTFPPVSSPTSVVIDGQTLTINPSQVIAPGTTINIPSVAPTNPLSAVTAGGLAFSVGSTAAVISGTTYAIGGGASPVTKVIDGQTLSFGPGGVGFASTTVPAAALSQVTAGGIAFAVGPTAAVISGTTFAIGNGAPAITTVIGDQTVSFGPNGVGFATTTIPVPMVSGVTVGDLTFVVGSTEAVISGTTFAIGNGASATTTVIGGQTVSFGPSGVGFASTTISVPTMSEVTVGDLTFSVGPTAAVISGTTYAIGNDASATTAVIGGQIVSFGPNGVGFASTTIPVPTASSTVATTPALQLFMGSASNPSIQGAAIVTLLAFGVGILLLL